MEASARKQAIAVGARAVVLLTLCFGWAPAGLLEAQLGGDEARTRERLLVALDGALEAAGSQDTPSMGLREELHALGHELEDSASRARTIEDAAELQSMAARAYFRAAVPFASTSRDDSIRWHLGSSWDDYVRLASGISRQHPDGRVGRLFAGRLLYSIDMLRSETYDFLPIYDAAFWQPAMEVYLADPNPVERAAAGAFVVAVSVWTDWKQATEVSNGLLMIGESETLGTRRDMLDFYNSVDVAFESFMRVLHECKVNLNRALRQYQLGGQRRIDENDLLDPAWMEQSLGPLLAHADSPVVRSSGDALLAAQLPEILACTPGMRIVGVDWVSDKSGQRRAVLALRSEFWEGYSPQDGGRPPWVERMESRLATLKD